MQLTVTADWTQPQPGADRIAIGGYTAVVVESEVKIRNFLGIEQTVFEYTVLHDHLAIVETGHRWTRENAKEVVEAIIANHAANQHANV